MTAMGSTDWEELLVTGRRVPSDRSLQDLTAELTTMLGDPDPHVREELAHATLASWIERGEYDDLLTGLGDGMSSGLTVGLGAAESDDAFRRGLSARVLAACIERDTRHPGVPERELLTWGDRVVSWLLLERDLRGFVPGKGWARVLAHGADAIGALGCSPQLGSPEQQMLLEVLAERLIIPGDSPLGDEEPDRFAHAVLRILRRDTLSMEELEPWVADLAGAAGPSADLRTGDPTEPANVVARNVQAFLRSLYLQLSLGVSQPAVRADLLLVLIEALRGGDPMLLGSPPGSPPRRD